MDVKGNFKTGQTDLKCRKCEMEEETRLHLLNCQALNDDSLVVGTLSYQDLFGRSRQPAGENFTTTTSAVSNNCKMTWTLRLVTNETLS